MQLVNRLPGHRSGYSGVPSKAGALLGQDFVMNFVVAVSLWELAMAALVQQVLQFLKKERVPRMGYASKL